MHNEEDLNPLDGRKSYVCLYKLAALVSYPGHKAEDIHSALGMHHIHHGIDHNERPGPSNSSTRDQGENYCAYNIFITDRLRIRFSSQNWICLYGEILTENINFSD